MKFSTLAAACEGTILQLAQDQDITDLAIDNRKITAPGSTVFFAWKGTHADGHGFVGSLYALGVVNFVVESDIDLSLFPRANMIKVTSSLLALQRVAMVKRSGYDFPVIGITGSNGKTIIKEWLYQLLAPDFAIVKNPGSYNSQSGVPLSVWNIQPHHNLGIFEAGISRPGEMSRLATIIQPTIGLFTNLGTAHDEGFENLMQKAAEKAKLFEHAQVVVYCRDHEAVHTALEPLAVMKFHWGYTDDALVKVFSPSEGILNVTHGGQQIALSVIDKSPAEIENLLHCIAIMLLLKTSPEVIGERAEQIRPVPMRLEVKEGIHQSILIDDSYNNDLAGLQISMEFLKGQRNTRRAVILSDVLQSGLPSGEWMRRIELLLEHHGVNLFIGIGPELKFWQTRLPILSFCYASFEEFIDGFDPLVLTNHAVLVKGARVFRFERIVRALQRKSHGTTMEVNLNAVQHNLRFFRSKLKAGTKVMAMVKALAYGSGGNDIAGLLQYNRVDYLGVAYADEGVELRQNGIRTPIMVMNPAEETLPLLQRHQLEPEVYSISLLESIVALPKGKLLGIHLKLDTGMHRLGLDGKDLDRAIFLLRQHPELRVLSVFSHLAAADDQQHDAFTIEQCERFHQLTSRIEQALGYAPIRHILNTAGILRFPQYQFDMARLGIGLYGVNPTTLSFTGLLPSSTLKTVVSQIKQLTIGDTVGYGRAGVVTQPMKIATIAVGYADGYSRRFGNGVGKVLINGRLAPVVGRVCMDMTMVDVTGIPVREGDEVILFGEDLPLASVAESIQTIPYEVLTQTGARVKRVFFAESI